MLPYSPFQLKKREGVLNECTLCPSDFQLDFPGVKKIHLGKVDVTPVYFYAPKKNRVYILLLKNAFLSFFFHPQRCAPFKSPPLFLCIMSNIPADSTPTEQPTQADPDRIVASYLKQKGYAQTEGIFLRESNGEAVPLHEVQDEASEEDEDDQIEDDNISSENAESTSTVLETEEDATIYDVSYKSLREWIENSLDWYKPELRSVLFPIFVHSFLDLASKNLVDNGESITILDNVVAYSLFLFFLLAKQFMTTYRSDHVELHTLDLDSLARIATPEHVCENDLAQLYRNNKYSLRMSGVPFELFLNYLQDNKFMLLLRLVNQYLNIQG
jgi:transcription initiation factor TFIID subunit 5